MKGIRELQETLWRIDGRGYKAYKDIGGTWDMGDFILYIDKVQGDPFASPSMLRARVDQNRAGFPAELFSTRTRRIALEDYLTRAFADAISRIAKGNRGTGKSGMIAIDRPGQEVLERTSMVVTRNYVEARFVVGLPARGRRILAQQAVAMLCEEVPEIVSKSLFYASLNGRAIKQHVELAEDQEAIRGQLQERGLISFIANGSILPRESGVSDRPMPREKAILFQSPLDLEVEFEVPNAGKVKGMGIKRGVTLIVGGGYHGKSTVLRAIERGVYNHIRGDGREFVITDSNAVKIRAEDGRRIEKVDISPFINNLPFGQDTRSFSTEDASGSTSQAANIIEALEMGASCLLVDEDTSATNFMIRDVRMQELVAKEKEPITPFIDKVRQLYDDLGVSTIIVVGGSGDYFDVADTVIMMDEYRPRHVTSEAQAIARKFATQRQPEGGEGFGRITARIPLKNSFDPTKGPKGKVKIGGRGVDEIRFGRHDIDLQYVEQIVDNSQTAAIGDLIYYAARRHVDGRHTLREVIELAMADVAREGLEVISPFRGHPGDYAMPRKFEVAAAINRLRTLRVITS